MAFGRSRVIVGFALAGAVGAIALGGAARGAGTGAPDPGGSSSALVPIPPQGKYFGFLDLSAGIPSRNVSAAQLATAVKSAGANIHRYIVQWQAVEPAKDTTSEGGWKPYTDLAKELRARGIRPLVTLSGVPPWARDPGDPQSCTASRGCEYPPAESMLGQWEEFAAEVAKRIPGAVIETWNEPDFISFFKPRPDPERWAELHVAAYRAIKAQDPSATVLAGGFTGNVNTQRDTTKQIAIYSTGEFLEQTYARIRGKLDGIAVHIYPPRAPFGIGADTEPAAVFEGIREARRKGKDLGRPIWVTEFGISTTGTAPLPERATEAEQAAGMIAGYRKILTMPDVESFIVHVLADQVEADPETRAYGFGVVESINPLVTKPAFCEFTGRAPGTPIGGCVRITDGGAAAKLAKSIRKRCTRWLSPSKAFRKAAAAKRGQLVAKCVLDGQTLTVESKRGLAKIDRSATRKAKRAAANRGVEGKARRRLVARVRGGAALKLLGKQLALLAKRA